MSDARLHRCRWPKAVLSVACLAGSSSVAAAPAQELSGALVCPRSAPGRVVCSVSLRSKALRLSWADVLVTRTPTFARPLRARIGFSERTEHTDRSALIPLALVAVADGEGQVEVKGRVVLCPERGGACSARTLALTASVRVESVESR